MTTQNVDRLVERCARVLRLHSVFCLVMLPFLTSYGMTNNEYLTASATICPNFTAVPPSSLTAPPIYKSPPRQTDTRIQVAHGNLTTSIKFEDTTMEMILINDPIVRPHDLCKLIASTTAPIIFCDISAYDRCFTHGIRRNCQ